MFLFFALVSLTLLAVSVILDFFKENKITEKISTILTNASVGIICVGLLITIINMCLSGEMPWYVIYAMVVVFIIMTAFHISTARENKKK